MYCNLNKNYCAHGRENKITCYNKFELLLIVEKIENIENRKLNFLKNENINELWKDIYSYMKSKYNCSDELCWVERLNLEDIEKTAFKPIMPDEWLECNTTFAPGNNCMNNWLSNYEIDNVLKQYEENVKNFEYLGSVPIDFANLPNKKINNVEIKKLLENGKNKIGVVFNTDPSYKKGQHWICAFIDLEQKEINFFDSYGSAGSFPKEINDFFNKIIKDAKENEINLSVRINTVRHQFKNSECGVYCLKFITERLSKDFDSIVKVPILDDEVNKERWNKFFRSKKCRPSFQFT